MYRRLSRQKVFELLCNLGAYQITILDCIKSRQSCTPFVHSSPNHRQLYHIAAFPRCPNVSITYNALYVWWKSARADNQWEVDWELQQDFIGGNGAGVGSKGTGSSHTVLVPRVQK